MKGVASDNKLRLGEGAACVKAYPWDLCEINPVGLFMHHGLMAPLSNRA